MRWPCAPHICDFFYFRFAMLERKKLFRCLPSLFHKGPTCLSLDKFPMAGLPDDAEAIIRGPTLAFKVVGSRKERLGDRSTYERTKVRALIQDTNN